MVLNHLKRNFVTSSEFNICLCECVNAITLCHVVVSVCRIPCRTENVSIVTSNSVSDSRRLGIGVLLVVLKCEVSGLAAIVVEDDILGCAGQSDREGVVAFVLHLRSGPVAKYFVVARPSVGIDVAFPACLIDERYLIGHLGLLLLPLDCGLAEVNLTRHQYIERSVELRI